MTGTRASVLQQMAQLSPLCSGSLHEQYLTCGKPECSCHDRKQPRKHGPYYLWIRRIGGKQVNRTLRPGPELDRVREGIANYQRIQQLFSKWLAEEESQVLEPERAVGNTGKKNFRNAETVGTLLADLRLDPLDSEEDIDTGAEEELFRRAGQQATTQAMAARWEQSDAAVEVQCSQCKQAMRPWGRRKKTIQTICGSVGLSRRTYYCGPCQQLRAPLDERLQVDQTGITPGLSRLICRTSLELAYDQSQRLLTDTLGFAPCSAREIERVADRHGQHLERLQSQGEIPQIAPLKATPKTYCLAIDGVMIPGLPDPVQHCLNWHDVKLAVAFDPRQVREPFYVAGREDNVCFGSRLWRQLQARQIHFSQFHMVLADGAPWIWNLVDEHLHGVPQLLDFYHAAEHLHATAQAIWPDSIATRWWQRRLDQLKEGALDNFFAALQWLDRRHTTTDPELSPARLLDYFQNNRQRLNYRWALDNKLPIGSGSVESAARHIVQQRLKQSGMRWSDPGAQAVLNLRTLHRNGQFEQYWENLAAVGL